MTPDAKTILIVDDQETIHKALERTLRREPYEILHAYDAAEADAILKGRSDVSGVICDHYMPGTHGLDLLMALRRSHPHLVTILLTAQADLQLVISAINEGHVDRFFTKPWSNEELRDQLRSLLFAPRKAPVVADAGGRVAQTAQRLRAELAPGQDEATGAFIIDPADLA
jgi:DNA-binding NtrC family response regulator